MFVHRLCLPAGKKCNKLKFKYIERVCVLYLTAKTKANPRVGQRNSKVSSLGRKLPSFDQPYWWLRLEVVSPQSHPYHIILLILCQVSKRYEK